MKTTEDPKPQVFEFKIDEEQLEAPREKMTADELINIAIESKVLDQVEGGYSLEDGEGNKFPPDVVIDLLKHNIFHATENEPGQAS